MSWHVVVRPEVHVDLAEAADWYETQRSGLGKDFVAEVVRVFPKLVANPY